jgi:hypothetical protein
MEQKCGVAGIGVARSRSLRGSKRNFSGPGRSHVEGGAVPQSGKGDRAGSATVAAAAVVRVSLAGLVPQAR